MLLKCYFCESQSPYALEYKDEIFPIKNCEHMVTQWDRIFEIRVIPENPGFGYHNEKLSIML